MSRRFHEAVLRVIVSPSWGPALCHHGRSGFGRDIDVFSALLAKNHESIYSENLKMIFSCVSLNLSFSGDGRQTGILLYFLHI